MAASVHHPRRNLRPGFSGLVLLTLGASLTIAGSIQTTASGNTVSCPSGIELIAKFVYLGGEYQFDSPPGNSGVVTISNGTKAGGDWDSSVPVSAVVVKADTDAKVTTYSPPQTSGHFDNTALSGGHHYGKPDISKVMFCGGGATPTTTTTVHGTTTTKYPHTTTTVHGTTTTTKYPPTTTSVYGTTTTMKSTTTVPPTTTTVPPTTTTVPPTTTTVPPTTTTVPPTTTTVPPTTTTVPPTTTTVPPTTTTTVADFVGGVQATRLTPPTDPSAAVLGVQISSDELPSTGSRSTPLILFGVVFLVAGLTLTVVGRARERRAIS